MTYEFLYPSTLTELGGAPRVGTFFICYREDLLQGVAFSENILLGVAMEVSLSYVVTHPLKTRSGGDWHLIRLWLWSYLSWKCRAVSKMPTVSRGTAGTLSLGISWQALTPPSNTRRILLRCFPDGIVD